MAIAGTRKLIWSPATLLVSGLLLLRGTQPAAAQRPVRDVAGTVVDQHHEPLKGAIVQVESPDTQSILSFITDADGHYVFKRLLADADYRIWATYRGHSSKRRFLSKFSNHQDRPVSLTIRLN